LLFAEAKPVLAAFWLQRYKTLLRFKQSEIVFFLILYLIGMDDKAVCHVMGITKSTESTVRSRLRLSESRAMLA